MHLGGTMQQTHYQTHRHADLSRPPAILPAQTSSHHPHAAPDTTTYRLHPAPMIPMANGNAVAGPSSISPSSSTALSAGAAGDTGKKKNSATTNGKKRRATADESEDSGTPSHPKSREGPKKKKAARACFHCQKAHLTCDDTRPCQRCVKRGMSDKCTEGHRKKAKYLLDDLELEALKKGKTPTQSTPEIVQPPPPPPPPGPVAEPFPSNDLYFGLPMDQGYGFGSEAANMEYSSLSAILGLTNFSPDQPFIGDTPPSASTSAFSQPFTNAAWPAEPQRQPQPNVSPQALLGGYDTNYGANMQQQQQQQSLQQQNGQSQYGSQSLFGGPVASTISPQQNGYVQDQMSMSQRTPSEAAYPTPELGYNSVQAQQMQISPTQPPHPQQSYIQPSPPILQDVSPNDQQQQQQQKSSQTLQSQVQRQQLLPPPPPPAVNRVANASAVSIVSPPSTDSPISTGSVNESVINQQNGAGYQVESQVKPDVYHSVVKAYDYTESYHFLMKFLPTRFEKNDILRVIRALAIYRPSIIALQTPMSDDDFIFMEKCLLRSLVELEKLISFSGTPTVVWRRTGEICAAGAEFCLLTDWKKEELINGRKYIYELFENQSVIEYWEKFASHAFENTTQSVFSHCVLLKPSGEPIPCTFCFSIRRDLFDLPSLVIGQWLPLM